MSKKDKIIDAIKELYGDTSCSREETKAQLEDIAAELEVFIESLDD